MRSSGSRSRNSGRQMPRSQMRFSKKHKRSTRPDAARRISASFLGGMAVARANLPQVLARHAVESIDGLTVITGGAEQFVKRRPSRIPSPSSKRMRWRSSRFFNLAVAAIRQECAGREQRSFLLPARQARQ